MTDYTVTRTVTVHDATDAEAAAARAFPLLAEPPDEWGSTVVVDDEPVVVKLCPSCLGGRLSGFDCVPCGNTGGLPLTQGPSRNAPTVDADRADWDRRHGR